MKYPSNQRPPITVNVNGNMFAIYDHRWNRKTTNFDTNAVIDALDKTFGKKPIKPRKTAIAYAQQAVKDALAIFKKTRIPVTIGNDTCVLAQFEYNTETQVYSCNCFMPRGSENRG